uniref:Profilin n=1 Tax=Ailuropoda melanoleuca TaxID=9646 RepID=A0A7N5J8L9_AILME
MSGWNAYTESLLDKNCQEAAIVGYKPSFSVWACTPATSTFANITAAQVEALVAVDRSNLFINGVSLGEDKCSLIRDNADVPDNHVMDLKTKSTKGLPAVNIAIGKTYYGSEFILK